MEVDEDIHLLSEAPERQGLIVQLASLLEIDFGLARRALEHCQWNFSIAVDAACELSSCSGSAPVSAEPSSLDHSASSSRTRASNLSGSEIDEGAQEHSFPVSARTDFPAHSAASSSQAPNFFGNAAHEVPEDHLASSSSGSSINMRKRPVSGLSGCLSHDAPDVFIAAVPTAKKHHHDVKLLEHVFKVPNNNSDPPAANPEWFQAHPLREEQRRSLGWMCSQEASAQTFLRGGLLADRMGYGKTSTTIGLISLDIGKALRTPGKQGAPLLKNNGYIPSDATLIVCPSHLVSQWEREFWKFLGSRGVQICKPQHRDVILKSAREEAHKLEINQVHGLQASGNFGIEVAKTPRVWTKAQHWALITVISPNTKPHLPNIKCGDAISGIICKNLQEENGTRKPSLTVKGLSRIKEFLDGKIYELRRIRTGERRYTDADGQQCVVPLYENRNIRMRLTEASTVLFTVMHLPDQIQRTLVVQGGGPLKVLTVREAADLEMLRQEDFVSNFHVILASAQIHSEQRYAEYIKDASGACGLMVGKISKLRSKVKEWSKENKALQRYPALFETVFWRRVILDEFHESETWEYRVREMLRGLKATHKWGLSGTPPIGSSVAVAEVAGLLSSIEPNPSSDASVLAQVLHYQTPSLRMGKGWRDWQASQSNVSNLKDAAESFVNTYIRQNTSELIEQIGIVEHEELVEHMSEERLIYRQACHDHGIFDLSAGYSEITETARADLLKRCSHFDMGEAADSAGAAVTRLGDAKREWVEKVQQQLWIEVARTRLFKAWEKCSSNCGGKSTIASTNVHHPEAKALVERVCCSSVEDVQNQLNKLDSLTNSQDLNSGMLAQSLRVAVKMLAQDGALRLKPEVRLIQPIRANEYYKDDRHRHAVLHAVAKRAKHHDADAALSEMAICQHACQGRLDVALCNGLSELVSMLDKAHRSLDFYNRQLNGVAQQDAADEVECSICLESACEIGSMAILPCSHVFHSNCVRAVLAVNPFCPECRAPVEKSHVSSVVMELKPPEPYPETNSGTSKNISAAWKQNGSKLNAIAQRLREIRKSDPKAKALVFVQWEDLETKVGRALTDHGVPYVCLSGSSSGRSHLGEGNGAVLQRFQEDESPDAPFVLVLSLQRAAAGTNLTSANHVLFVHPMNAETVQTAAAYERQALARVRRIGQKRKEVHVWRFLTKNTVEEHIWKLHRNAPETDQENAQSDHVNQ